VTTSPHHDKLKAAMDERLLDLNLTLTQLAIDSGVDRDTIRRWRANGGTRRPAPRMTRPVERRLFWAPGSIQALLDGGEAIPLEIPETAGVTGSERDPVAWIRSLDRLTREEQDAVIGVIAAAIAQAADKQERRRGA